ncbi:MAG: TonB-dependent receptor [Proteobacteria bacterium]|nr:TonB-dependent receptor [Pseudomonadota bacterium]
MAQDQAADDAFLEEIIVTSRRYEESVSDTPLAVNVMTRSFLENQGIESIFDILEASPGATFVEFHKAQPEKSIRGIVAPTPGNSSSTQSIQTVVDGMVISKDFMKSQPIFDLQRVEILRGPQGTTFGRNASVGLISLITNKPSQEFEAAINVTAANGETYEADGYISGGLSETLSARVAVNFDTADGPTKSISTGEGLDGTKNFAIRGSLLYEPTESFSVYLKVEYSKDDDEGRVRHGTDCTTPYIDGPRAVNDPITGTIADIIPNINITHPRYPTTFFDPCDPFLTEISINEDFFLKRDVITVTGEIAWEISEGVTVTSITGYMDGESDSLADVLGSPENIVFQKVENEGDMFSEEIRIDNHGTGNRFRWLAGLYYLNDTEHRFEENRFFQAGGLNPAPGPPTRVPSRLATDSNNETNSIALFGEVVFDVTDRLEIAVGGRWTKDSKDYLFGIDAFGFAPVIAGVQGVGPSVDEFGDPVPSCVDSDGDGVNNPGPPPVCGDDEVIGFAPISVSNSWSNFSAKVSATYRIDNQNMIYALWSQGFKSGGFQPDARDIAAAQVPFDEETVNNFELGWKGSYDRALFALTAFWIENKDFQATTLIPVGQGFTALITNLGKVRSKGIEAEGTFALSEDFLVGGTFALIDAELIDTQLVLAVLADGTQVLEDLSGQRPDSAPKYTATLWGEYTYPFSGGSSLSLRADWMLRSNMFDDLSERAFGTRVRPKLSRIGVRATWTSADGRYRVSGWGKNLTEDVDITNFGPRQPNTLQLAAGFTGKRSYGVTVGAKF